MVCCVPVMRGAKETCLFHNIGIFFKNINSNQWKAGGGSILLFMSLFCEKK